MQDLQTVPDRPRPRNWIAALRGFARLAMPAAERCEWCGREIAAEHSHLIEPASRRLLCACASCALRADDGEGAYRRIPEEVCLLADFRMSDAEWDALMIPIGLAFFFRSTPAGRIIAMYPGPAGAVESLLDLDPWHSLVSANPELAALRPDVEALLVYRVGEARRYYRSPIDRCYALVGLIRKEWRGLSGGATVWQSIDRFFAGLQAGDGELLAARRHA